MPELAANKSCIGILEIVIHRHGLPALIDAADADTDADADTGAMLSWSSLSGDGEVTCKYRS
jgi:hypothetical protein